MSPALPLPALVLMWSSQDQVVFSGESLQIFRRENDRLLARLDADSSEEAFYEEQGYEVFGELDDFPKGHTMFYMKKVRSDE